MPSARRESIGRDLQTRRVSTTSLYEECSILHLHSCSSLSLGSVAMHETNKKFQVIVKNVHTFNGKNAGDFIVWYEKIRISLDIYDRAVFGVLLGESQSPVPTVGDTNAVKQRAVWNTANEDLYTVLFFTMKGAACPVFHRRQDTRQRVRTRTLHVGSLV